MSVNNDFKFLKLVRNGKSGTRITKAREKRRKRNPIGGRGGNKTDKPIFTTGYVVPHSMVAKNIAKKAVIFR